MSVRSKIVLILISVLIAYECVDIVIQNKAIYSKFTQLENGEALKDVARCVDAINREKFHLIAFNSDWAYWNDSYDFVLKPNDAFLKSNISETTLKDAKLNMLSYYDYQGSLIWGRIQDANQNNISLRDFARMSPDNPLLVKFDANSPDTCIRSGLILTEKGPMLIVARPVLHADKTGPAHGVLMTARFLDDNVVEELKTQTNVDFSLKVLGNGLTDQKATIVAISKNHGAVIETLDKRMLSCSDLLRDIEGNPAVLLTAQVKRSITQQGRSAIFFALASGFVASLVVLSVILILLQKTIIQPLSTLTGHVTSVGKNADLSVKLDMNRSDEIGTLAKEFDSMLGELAVFRKKLVTQSYNSGKAEIASGVLHNLRNSLTPVVSKIEMLRTEMHAAPIDKLELARKQLTSDDLAPERKVDLEKYIDLAGQKVETLCVKTQTELDALACKIKDIEDILGSSQLLSRAKRVFETVRLDQLIRESISMVSADLIKKVNVYLDPSVAAVAQLKVDRIALMQVFVNVIVNGAESVNTAGTANGCIKITVENCDDTHCHLVFIDNGHGISQDKIARLFDRGFTTKDKPTQSGIGLHWCANTMLALKGKIWLESPGPGKGASVHIDIPVANEVAELENEAI